MKGMKLPSPAMVVALIALLLAVGGTAYAGAKLGKNSVGSKQLKKDAVTSPKVKDGSLTAGDFDPGSLPEGPRGARGERGLPGPEGPQGDAGPAGRSALTPLKIGETIRGAVAIDDQAREPIESFGTQISFPIPLSISTDAYYVDGVTPNETCTGAVDNPTAPPGTLCVYPSSASENINGYGFIGVGNPVLGVGFSLTTTNDTGDVYFYGTWAVTNGEVS
jgi:hypothetical protein